MMIFLFCIDELSLILPMAGTDHSNLGGVNKFLSYAFVEQRSVGQVSLDSGVQQKSHGRVNLMLFLTVQDITAIKSQ